MSTHCRFEALTPSQQAEARARFIDAGAARDDYWYELTSDGHVLCRTRGLRTLLARIEEGK